MIIQLTKPTGQMWDEMDGWMNKKKKRQKIQQKQKENVGEEEKKTAKAAEQFIVLNLFSDAFTFFIQTNPTGGTLF